MKRYIILSSLLVSLSLSLMAQTQAEKQTSDKMVRCEPSIMINVFGGPTRLDNVWKGEFTLDVAIGAQFRNGHAVYAGMGMQQVHRDRTYDDRRNTRTNLPLYLQYQWRMFGWHRDCADRHAWSPFVGLKAGWNFLQDVYINETLQDQHVVDLSNEWFVTPQIGIDYRCAEYMSIGLVAEAEVSRRYVGDGGGWCKPRVGLVFKF